MAKLTVSHLFKRFGSLLALNDVSLSFDSGSIHAVLGENGAGKSTLMNIMSGFLTPDEGEVLLDGKAIPHGMAFQCKHLGIEMIHQHFTLVPAFTVAENLALAHLGELMSTANVTQIASKALKVAEDLGWPVQPDVRTDQLSVGQQQRLEILKAISGEASVLIFDEPTAVLAPHEVEDLFRVLRSLKDSGKCVILIAHKLSEVLSVADRISVLRRGKLIASEDRDSVDAQKLAEWMVGDLPPKVERIAQESGEVCVRAKSLSVLGDRKETAVRDVTFDIRRGEVLGFGGVDGNGQLELAECIAQIRPSASGVIHWELSSEKQSIGYIPQDRHVDGLALNLSIEENMLVTGLSDEKLTWGPMVLTGSVREWANRLIQEYSIKVDSPTSPARSLSGGNQQKIIVSRTLDQNPELLVVQNPGRGLDIKATDYVHRMILEARSTGTAIALFSTDLEELYKLSDRVLFMVGGRLVEDEGALSLVGGTA